jgi:hypothetical protein
MSNDFLPAGYERQESAGSYMKLVDGENRFRVLSSAITGWEWWEDDGKGNRLPKRVRKVDDVPSEAWNREKKDRPREFWAFAVYNYDAKAIQILELKQQSIMGDIEKLVRNAKWGSPKEYDVAIIRTKTGSQAFDVEYSVMPEPKEPIDPGIVKAYEDMAINLEALYEGGDPFAAGKQAAAEQKLLMPPIRR